MTTKYLTGAYPKGYALNSKYKVLIIDASASVGGSGVSATSFATIVNHGLIDAYSSGVFLHDGGTVINGSATDTSAVIDTTAGKTILAYGQANTVINYGTVQGGGFSGDAVRVYDGSSNVVTNFGTLAGGGALANGLTVGHCSDVTVTNAGVISGPLGSGIWFSYDDADNNTVSNSGTIEGGGYGILFQSGGGVVTNGSASDISALIGANNKNSQGVWALSSAEEAYVSNFGTIVNWSTTSGNGVALKNGGVLTNGSSGDATALIDAYGGVGVATYGASPVTLTNFGTIVGIGTAVSFSSSADVLQVEAGCAFEGAVRGAGGTLDLASGEGGISLGGGNVMVSGSMAPTTFSQFGTLEISNGARFKLTGTATIGGGGIARLVDDGTLVVARAITGTGTLAVGAGDLIIQAGATVDVSSATFAAGAIVTGSGTLILNNATVAGLSVGEAASMVDIGTVTQTGNILLRDGAQSARRVVESGAIWKLDGNVGIDRRLSENPAITVYGLLVKSAGSGVGAIGVYAEIDGVAEAARGTLDFVAGVTGSGTLKIDAGATIECGGLAGPALTATFRGAGATLALKDPAAFGATIAGFASGESIDLLDVAATSAVLGAGDTLVIADGPTPVATLQLSGDYAGDTFATGSDGKGGTSITLSTSPGAPPQAALHSFIAAAASLGAAHGGEAFTATHFRSDGLQGGLLAPRVQVA
jgi:uncharacterized protein (UPF0333 family)